MTDDDLRRDVAAELCWDPRVDSAAIEVSAASGLVTLRGTVASLWHKRAGGNAAARVRGVSRVANGLRVQIPDRDRRDDEDLRGDVLEALMLEGSVPMTVDAQARDGFVTLTGTVEWHYQREAAESRTASVPGVVRHRQRHRLGPGSRCACRGGRHQPRVPARCRAGRGPALGRDLLRRAGHPVRHGQLLGRARSRRGRRLVRGWRHRRR